MLEIADREFQAIQDEDERLRRIARESVIEGRLHEVEITPDALKVYLDRTLGPDARMSEFSYQYTAGTLRQMGFVNFQQVDQCLDGYDPDLISRMLWGTRQGQITRFEDALLAAMGDAFILRHRYKTEPWFIWRRVEHLEQLKAEGVQIGSYRPSPDIFDGMYIFFSYVLQHVRGEKDAKQEELLERILGAFQARDVKVLRLLYGLEGGEHRSPEQVGDILGISAVRVSQILSRAFHLLGSVSVEPPAA
jgi:hypothetical protein